MDMVLGHPMYQKRVHDVEVAEAKIDGLKDLAHLYKEDKDAAQEKASRRGTALFVSLAVIALFAVEPVTTFIRGFI